MKPLQRLSIHNKIYNMLLEKTFHVDFKASLLSTTAGLVAHVAFPNVCYYCELSHSKTFIYFMYIPFHL